MAKSLGSYRGYGCMYEQQNHNNHFILSFYRHGYAYEQSFSREVTGFENNLYHKARKIIDQQYALKEEKRYEGLPDLTVPTHLKRLPQ